ncbi:hypothetical protein C0J52_10056 [Blattella germanica]|nr:hypothetical protein C0J52_10056 [Blattella germanica]
MPKKKISDKTRAWERDRRERINASFTQLSKLLPNHEPTVTLRKLEILQKAASHIRELQQENRNLLQGTFDESAEKEEPKQNKKKVKKPRLNATPLKTIMNNSSRAVPAKQIVNTSHIPSIPAKKSKNAKPKKPINKLFGDKLPTVAQLLGLTMNDIESSPVATISVHETPSVGSPALINTTASLPPGFIVIQGNGSVQQTSTSLVNQQQCIVVPAGKKTRNSSQPISLILSNSTSRNMSKRKKNNNLIAMTKSHLLTAPVIANGVQTCPPPAVLTNHGTGLAGLGPGTLILANGNIVPVLPPPQTVLAATPTQFFVNSPAATPPPVIMMQQQKTAVTITTSTNGAPLVAAASSISKPQQRSIPVLVPKAADSTKTTFANKMPIPALTLRHPLGRTAQGQVVASSPTKSSAAGKAKGKSNDDSIKLAISAPSKKPSSLDSKSSPEKEKDSLPANKSKAPKESGTAKDGSQDENTKKHEQSSSETTLASETDKTSKGEISSKRKNVCSKNEEDGNKKKMLKRDGDNICEGENSLNQPSSTYTIDALCTSKPRSPPPVNKSSKGGEDASAKEDSSSPTEASSHDSPTTANQKDSETAAVASNSSKETQDADKEGSSESSPSSAQEEITQPSVLVNQNVENQFPAQHTEPQTVTSISEHAFASSSQEVQKPSSSEQSSSRANSPLPQLQEVSSSKATDSSPGLQDATTAFDQIASQIPGTESPSKLAITNVESEAQVTECPSSLSQNNNSPKSPNLCSVEETGKSSQVSCPLILKNQQTSENDKPISGALISESHSGIETQLSTTLSTSTSGSEEPSPIQSHAMPKDAERTSQILENVIVTNSTLEDSRPETENDKSKETSWHLEKAKTPPASSASCQLNAPLSNEKNPEPSLEKALYSASFASAPVITHCSENAFIPITNSTELDPNPRATDNDSSVHNSLSISLQNHEFSNDLFASLQVPTSEQHPESISPTAAFLLAFPLVSSSKVSEMIVDSQEEVGGDSMQGASTLLQIGNIEPDAIECDSKARSDGGEAKTQQKMDSPSENDVSNKSEGKSTSLQSNEQRIDMSASGDKGPEKCSTSEASIPPTSNKQWSNIESRSVGTQAQAFDDFRLKSSEYQLSPRAAGNHCFSQQIKAPFKSDHQHMFSSVPPLDRILQNVNSKKSTNSSAKFPNPVESLCLKPPLPVSQMSTTFNVNKEQCRPDDKQDSQQTSGNSMVRQQHPFSKLQTPQVMTEQGTMTEDSRNVCVNYKATSSSASDVKHSFSSQGVAAPVHSSRALSYGGHMPPTSMATQSYSYNLFANDYNGTSPQVTYSSSTNEQIKTTGTGSFSVAHNSSNFSILSWTTLSPMSAPTNTSQYDSFHMPSQSLSTNASHQQTHTTAVSSIQKTIPQTDMTMADNSCQKQCKPQERNNAKPMSGDAARKVSGGTYHSVYSNTEQQSLGIPHMQYHADDTENFKYPISTVEGKNRQSTRTTHTGERVKAGQHHRPPVNWMTTPDIRTSSSASSTGTSVGQPIISMPTTSLNSEVNSVQMNREFEFCSTSSSNNIFLNNSNITQSTFDSRNFSGNSALYGSSSVHGNLYTNNNNNNNNNNRQSCNKDESNQAQRLPVPAQNYHNEASYPLPWSARKVSFASAPEMSTNNFVPSTLPTLVGDLALGTNYPISGNEDNHHKSFLQSNFDDASEVNKKDTGKQIPEKDSETATGNKMRICSQEYHGPSTSGNFLSVSQLVDQVKSGTGSSRAQARRNGNNRPAGNKSQTRQHNANVGSANKRNNSERDGGSTKKQQQVNFPVSEGTNAMPPENNRKTTAEAARETHYSTENGFSMPSQHHWLPNRGKPSNPSSYKAPVSSYSAEALIGNNLSQEPPNKVISLPPPVVSERFSHNHQNYHHHPQTSRSLQASSSFSNDALIPSNYFAGVDSQHQDGGAQTSSHNDNFTQNQQSYGGNSSFSYSAGTTNMSGQSIYPPANFASNANTNTSLPTGFLSDLPIHSDSNGSLIFAPPSIMKGVQTNRSGRHNTYLNTTPSTIHHQHQHLTTRNDNLSGQTSSEANRIIATSMSSSDNSTNRRPNVNATGLTLHHQNNNLSTSNNTNCSLSKRSGASRRRIPEPISSTSTSGSGITGLVDLGYLPMPPGIGSPMLGTDDGTYLSHHAGGTFLAHPGSQLYPGGPAPAPQGALYSRPPAQATSQNNHHSGSHLPPFSTCAPMQQNQHMPQQQQANSSPNATNASGNSLANFNLSTIFPEINDKQVPAAPPFPGGSKNLASSSASANGSHHLLPSTSSDAEYSHRVVPTSSNCLPPVPLPTNFNNLLSHAPPPQVGRMQWP